MGLTYYVTEETACSLLKESEEGSWCRDLTSAAPLAAQLVAARHSALGCAFH